MLSKQRSKTRAHCEVTDSVDDSADPLVSSNARQDTFTAGCGVPISVVVAKLQRPIMVEPPLELGARQHEPGVV